MMESFIATRSSWSFRMICAKQCFLALALITLSEAYKPVFLVHGVLTGKLSMLPIADRIAKLHPGTTIYITDRFGGWSSLEPMWHQVEELGADLLALSAEHPEGVNLIGYSQGGLLSRAILSRYPEHNVHTFISLSSPQGGQYGTKFLHLFFPNLTCHTAYELFYSYVGQRTSVGNYWNDPHHQELFFKYSQFLPYINNQLTSNSSDSYKTGFTKLKKLVLVGGPDDGVITPWQSSQFGYYDEKEDVYDMRQNPLYKNDSFGLRTLDEAGKDSTFRGFFHDPWTRLKKRIYLPPVRFFQRVFARSPRPDHEADASSADEASSSERAGNDAARCLEINDLPDEILMAIFGFIVDGRTLLDGVSLVSRRWHALAQEPWSWASASVRVPACAPRAPRACRRTTCSRQRQVTDASRVILHAPVLQSVTLAEPVGCDCELRVVDALRRTEAKVRGLRGVVCDGEAHDRRSWAADLLGHVGDRVEELQLVGARREHMVLVRGMASLRRLDVHWGDMVDEDAPVLPLRLEQLKVKNVSKRQVMAAQRMPNLRRLSLYGFRYEMVLPPLPRERCGLCRLSVEMEAEKTLLPLLRSHAATLQVLEVTCSSSASTKTDYCYLPRLAEGLGECELRALRRVVLRRSIAADNTWHHQGEGVGYTKTLSHDAKSCRAQKRAVRAALRGVTVLCGECDGKVVAQ